MNRPIYFENGTRHEGGHDAASDSGRRYEYDRTMKVLIVEDVRSDAELVMREVRKLEAEIVPEVVDTRETYLKAVEEFDPDIVLSDYSLPQFDGMSALKILQERKPATPFIMVTGSQNEEIAVECMKAGAADYMLKENLKRIGPAIMAALEKYRLMREKGEAEEAVRRSRDELEKLVKERTAELEARNEQLEREIADRMKAQEEKKSVEEQLAQAQKIEALGRFAGGIAHDLNNILYPIVINTEMLLEESDPGTETHEVLDQILNAAYRQRDLVKQILSFSRRSEKKLSLVSMVPLVEDTLNFLKSLLPSTIEIRQQIDVRSDAFMGDPAQIHQVIVNLCRNAADAVPSQKGIIDVRLANVRLEGLVAYPDIKPGEYLELSVEDNGLGMTAEVKDRIFEPFFTTKEVDKGSGMGLPVVHGIMKNHGGAVTVDSDPGKGTRFTLYIPLSEDMAQTREAPFAQKEQGPGSVLLVDDEEIILSSLKRALERLGYRVSTAENGVEALDIFQSSPDTFRLVITDLTMPHMTGVELGKRILEVRPGTPVVLCTGYSDTINEEEAVELGFKALIMKPAGTRELKIAVGLALEG